MIRFYAELNDFLHPSQKHKSFEFFFKGRVTVREAVESLGVPHSAVDLILINGQSAGIAQKVEEGDLISVYPEFETFDISEISEIRKKPLRSSCFIVDAHLGKLTRDLRMLGFDSLFAGKMSDMEIINVSVREKRTILTRDRDLLKSQKVDHGYYVRETRAPDQLREVITRFDLWSQFRPFTRCLVCNGILQEVDREEVIGLVKPELTAVFEDFYRCSECKRIYWEGSHYLKMLERINGLIQGSGLNL